MNPQLNGIKGGGDALDGKIVATPTKRPHLGG